MTSILKVDTIQDADGNNIINENSNTITIGASGDTTNIVGTLQNNGAGVGGITEADQWRLTTSFTGDADPIASNLSRASSYGAGYLGTGMTESSGIFTFPSTGIYQILWTLRVEMSTGYRHQMNLKTTLDNSSYNIAGYIRVNGSSTQGDNQSTATQSFLFDVTDTSLCKCQFQIVDESGSDNNTTLGNANYNLTCMSFIRLGDT